MESGRGSIREAYEYLCHPDILKSMNVGQALLLEHGPKSVVLLNIRNARDSKAFQKVEARPETSRPVELRKSYGGLE